MQVFPGKKKKGGEDGTREKNSPRGTTDGQVRVKQSILDGSGGGLYLSAGLIFFSPRPVARPPLSCSWNGSDAQRVLHKIRTAHARLRARPSWGCELGGTSASVESAQGRSRPSSGALRVCLPRIVGQLPDHCQLPTSDGVQSLQSGQKQIIGPSWNPKKIGIAVAHGRYLLLGVRQRISFSFPFFFHCSFSSTGANLWQKGEFVYLTRKCRPYWGRSSG